jgi:hypothetical protein
VLVDRAQQVLSRVGDDSRIVTSLWEFIVDDDLIRYSLNNPDGSREQRLFVERPGGLLFAYRTSPRALVPLNPVGAITLDDPPFDSSGMTELVLDPDGQLLSFLAVPPQKVDGPEKIATPDWPALFQLAGLDMSRFHVVTPNGCCVAMRTRAWHGKAPSPTRSERCASRLPHGEGDRSTFRRSVCCT